MGGHPIDATSDHADLELSILRIAFKVDEVWDVMCKLALLASESQNYPATTKPITGERTDNVTVYVRTRRGTLSGRTVYTHSICVYVCAVSVLLLYSFEG